jgi:hypothetical protein
MALLDDTTENLGKAFRYEGQHTEKDIFAIHHLMPYEI